MKRQLDFEAALKALAYPTRVDFVRWLKHPEVYFNCSASGVDGGVPAGMFQINGLSQAAASQHLIILQEAGLLTARRDGRTVLYSRNEVNIAEFKRRLEAQLTEEPESVLGQARNRR